MKVARALGEVQRDLNSVVTVGTFDGVHLAHREILRDVVSRARSRKGRSVVVTLHPHPKEVVASTKGAVKLLSTLEERVALMAEMGVDLLFVVNFTFEFSRLTPREFYRTYVVNGVGVSEVIVGYDHMFGRDRQAGIEELLRMGQEFEFSVFAVHPFTVEGETVSSTLIRRALMAGDVERARRFLGYPYRLGGTIVPGDGRGKSIGFPTANIMLENDRKVVPGNGVYAVGVRLGEWQYHGMLNVGVRPTFAQDGGRTIEVHIFDFSRDVYGERVEVEFLGRLRDERKFANVEELINQLGKDKEQSLRVIAGHVTIS